MNEKQPAVCLALMIGLFLASTVATAIPIISIDDSTDITVLSANSDFDSFTPLPGPPEGPALFVATFTDTGAVPTFTTPLTFYITEGPPRPGQPISDLLIISFFGHTPGSANAFSYTVSGSFVSNSEPGNLGVVPPGTPGSFISREDGTFNAVFTPDRPGAAQGEPPVIRIRVNSDAPESTIPEPATFALLGLGLAGLGFSRRRKSN